MWPLNPAWALGPWNVYIFRNLFVPYVHRFLAVLITVFFMIYLLLLSGAVC